jgi:hypothetical protein
MQEKNVLHAIFFTGTVAHLMFPTVVFLLLPSQLQRSCAFLPFSHLLVRVSVKPPRFRLLAGHPFTNQPASFTATAVC